MATKIDIMALAKLMRSASQAEIVPRFRRLGDGDVRVKTHATDVVTEADEAAERFLQVGMEDVLPGALFIGEESVAHNPDLLLKLPQADFSVIVDPIDGTYNYASGIPLFAVMAAVVSKGETVAGVIYDPKGDDWMLAEKGAGAWQVRPDGSRTRLNVQPRVALSEMYGASSTGYLPGGKRATILANMAKVAFMMSYRCAGHEYRAFASGHMHFLMYNKLMPWDHLAGTLIVQEAGGYVARFDGSAYLPQHLDGGLIAASDKQAWDELRREVFTI